MESLDARILMANNVFGILTGNVEWNDSIAGYALTGDVIIPAGSKLTVREGVTVTGSTGNRIRVLGEFVSESALFTGPQMQIVVENGGKGTFQSGTHIDGLRLQFDPLSQGSVTDTQITTRLENYSPNVTFFGNRFTPGVNFPTFAPITTTPSLVDRIYNGTGNTFDAPAEINLVTGTSAAAGYSANAVLSPYANVARYVVAGDLNIIPGTSLTVPSGVELRTYSAGNDVLIDGTMTVTGATISNNSEFRAQAGGTLNISGGTTLNGDGVFYLPGSFGTVQNSAFQTASLYIGSANAVVQSNTFQIATRPIQVEGDFVPKIYNGNTFAALTSIGVSGIVQTDVTWTDYPNIVNYQLVEDLTVAPLGKLTMKTVLPNNLSLTTPSIAYDITVQGTLLADRVRFLGSTEIIAVAGSVFSTKNLQITGERLELQDGAAATITGTTLTLPVELYTHLATITDTTFGLAAVAPLPPLPVLTYPSLVPLLYDKVGTPNTFLANTAIRVIGIADTDAAWEAYPNIAEYRIEGAVTISAAAHITTGAGVVVRMDENADVINVDGSWDSLDTSFIGTQTELIARTGGTLNLRDDASVSGTTTVINGVINYQPGSEGVIEGASLPAATLFAYSEGLEVNATTFGGTNQVYILPSLVPDLYDNTFQFASTIRVQGATTIDTHWAAYPNISSYQLSDDLIVGTGFTLTIGDSTAQVLITTPSSAYDIFVDGALSATNTYFSGISTEIIARNNANTALASGDLRLLDATRIDGQRVEFQSRSTGLVRSAVINTNVTVNILNELNKANVRLVFNDFTNGRLILAGDSTVTFDATRQFWGTGVTTVATIEPKVQHRNDDPTRPLADFSQPLPAAPDPSTFPPSLTTIADQTAVMNTIIGPLGFIVSDVDTPPAQLIVTATSSNTALIPNGNILFPPVAPGAPRQIQLSPNADEFGQTRITIHAEDSDGFATDTAFFVTITPPNSPPTIASLAPIFILEDQPLENPNDVPIFVGDSFTPVANLTVAVTATSNPDLLPLGLQSIRLDPFTGFWRLAVASAPDRFTPATQSVADTLTITVSDGQFSVDQTVSVHVAPTNDAPRISLTNVRVAPNSTGAIFGQLVITDPDEGDTILSTSISGSSGVELAADGVTLKLSDFMSWAPGDQGEITVTAVDSSGSANGVTQAFFQLYASSQTPLVRVEMRAVDAFGLPISTVNIDDPYFVQGLITDLRPGAQAEGVLQSYVFLLGDAFSNYSGVGYGSLFPNGHQAFIAGSNIIYAGGQTDPAIPAVGTQTLFTLQSFPVVDGGLRSSLIQVFDPSFPTLLANSAGAPIEVAPDQFEFIPLSLTVISAPTNPPVIDVTGGGGNPINGQNLDDPNPADNNGTVFGSIDVNAGSASHAFVIQNLGSGPLNLIGSPTVIVSGEAAGDFTVTAQPTAGPFSQFDFTNFTLTFDPLGVGTRTALVTIWNDEPGATPFQFLVQGTGTELPLAPTDITLAKTHVNADTDGAVVGNVTVVDPNFANTFTYVVSDPRFEVVNDRLKLKDDVRLSPTTPSISLTITVTDQNTLPVSSISRTFTITVDPLPPLIRLSLQALKPDGSPLTTLVPYQNFLIRASVEDRRATAQGVKSAYFDLAFDPDFATPLLNGSVTFDPLFPNLRTVGTQIEGLLDEAGAAAGSTALGAGVKKLFEAQFRVGSQVGAFTFTPTLAGSHLSTLFGLAAPVRAEQVEFMPLTLTVTAATAAWHNPNLSGDIDDNKTIDVQDIAYAVFFYGTITNRNLTGTAPDPAAPFFIDVVPDNSFDVQDIAQLVYDYGIAIGNGEGESAPPAAGDDGDDLVSLLAEDVAGLN